MYGEYKDDDYFQSSSDDGSVWTSYSDLFTTMAIIFLVMFVFALIKSSVSSLKAIQQKQEAQEMAMGKLPKKVQEKINKNESSLEKSLQGLDKINKDILTKISSLNELDKQLQNHRDDIKKLLKNQKLEKGISSTLQIKFQETSRELNKLKKTYSKQVATLRKNKKVLNNTISQKKNLEKMFQKINSKKIELTKSLNTVNQQNLDLKELLQRKIVERDQLNIKYQKMIKENTQQKTQLSQLSQSEKQYQNQLKEISNKNVQLAKGLEQSQQTKANLEKNNLNYKNKISELKDANKQLTSTLSSNDQAISKLTGESSKLKKTVGKLSFQNKDFQSQIGRLQGKLNHLNQVNSNLNQEKMRLSKKLGIMAGNLKGEKAKNLSLNQTNGRLKSDNQALSDKQSQFKNRIKSLKNDNDNNQKKLNALFLAKENCEKSSNKCNLNLQKSKKLYSKKEAAFRSNIAQDLANSLRKANINANVDMATATVILQMDDDLLFKRNSFELDEKAKNKLRKIIPIYAKTLFKNGEQIISRVSIEGHASPSFKQKYVPITEDYLEAYNYNMTLSTNRALSIVKYLLSEEIGAYGNKNLLRKKLQAIGRSFNSPIKNTSNKDDRCGPYNCKLSRRVEITFSTRNKN